MKGLISSIIITVILLSLFELLLPKGNIKKVAISVIGVIVVAIILTPIVNFVTNKSFNILSDNNFIERRDS